MNDSHEFPHAANAIHYALEILVADNELPYFPAQYVNSPRFQGSGLCVRELHHH